MDTINILCCPKGHRNNLFSKFYLHEIFLPQCSGFALTMSLPFTHYRLYSTLKSTDLLNFSNSPRLLFISLSYLFLTTAVCPCPSESVTTDLKRGVFSHRNFPFSSYVINVFLLLFMHILTFVLSLSLTLFPTLSF